MKISIIAAIAQNGVIGNKNKIPWRLKSDMQWFREKTMGHTVVMGRKTFESIGVSLPNRLNIVVTSQRGPYTYPARTLVEAIEKAEHFQSKEAFIIGGSRLYSEALPLADNFYRTKVWALPKGDTTFPEYSEDDWEVEYQSDWQPVDKDNEYPSIRQILRRVNK